MAPASQSKLCGGNTWGNLQSCWELKTWGLPPNYTPADPNTILPDITDPERWQAYNGSSGVDALQAFYLREAPIHGWEITEFVPFSSASDLGFARLQIRKEDKTATLGIMPSEGKNPTGTIAIKYG